MKEKGTMDLTVGSPLKQILFFSIPLVLGTLFQQLYSFADTIMVGRLISSNALAAVGVTYSFQFLTIGFVQGACVGFGIMLSHAVGSKDRGELKRYFWNGVWLCIITGIVMTLLTLIINAPVLRLIRTPDDIFADAEVSMPGLSSWAYLQQYFITILPWLCVQMEIRGDLSTFLSSQAS